MYQYSRERVFGRNPVALSTYEMTWNEPCAPHGHDFLEIVLCVGGSAIHTTRSSRRPVEQGSVLVIRPGDWHGYSECHDFRILNFYIGTEILRKEVPWIVDTPALARWIMQGGDLPSPISEDAVRDMSIWGGQIAALQGMPLEPRRHVLFGLLRCVFGVMAQFALEQSIGGQVISNIVRDGLNLLENDIAEDWSLSALAQRLNISPSYLNSVFISQLGSSVGNWIAGARAEKAAVLLIQTSRPVASIGREVGWRDPNYMSRAFKKVMNASPSEYRSRYRLANATGTPISLPRQSGKPGNSSGSDARQVPSVSSLPIVF